MATPDVPLRDDGAEDEGGFDAARLLDYLSYIGRALRLHPLLAAAVFAAVAGATLGLVSLMPKKYHVESTLLAQNNQVIAALGNPSRVFPREDVAPTRSVSETVLSHDNLVSLVKQVGLVERWKQRFGLRVRLRALVNRVLGRRALSDDELVDALVFLLQTNLVAWSADNRVVIGVNWDDPDVAVRIVEAAQQNFMERRHVTDTGLISESISILEGHLAAARQEVDAAMALARGKRQEAARAGALMPYPAFAPQAASGERPGGQELARLRVLLESKRRAVRDLEDFRQRRLGELQAQLAEQKAVYAESHPVILNLRQSVEALGQDSPQLASLRRELQDLEAQYAAKGGKPADVERDPDDQPRFIPAIIAPERDSRENRDPAEDYAQSRLSAAISRYNTLVDRMANARMELDAARAAFKYRYMVVEPPRPPQKPLGGAKTLAMLAAGLIAAFVLALAAAVAGEARTGLIVQSWQVERSLGLKVLLELPRG
jgi:uncharacterized protein involved in exopolysaccharide biosynthesis